MPKINFNQPVLMNLTRCYYYLTYKCNSRCRYCNIWDGMHRETNGSRYSLLPEIKGIIKSLKRLGTEYIDFTGGEILLRNDLIPILAIAKEEGFPIIITTNGILYSRWSKLLKGLVDHIQFSLDTLNSERYRKRRGIVIDYVLEGIEKAASLSQKFGIFCTVDEENIEDIEELIQFSEKYRCGLSINPIFSYFKKEELKEGSVEYLKRVASYKDVYLNLDQINLILSGGNRIESPRCVAVSRNIAISPDGSLLLPCFHRYVEKISIQNNLEYIYHSQRINELRHMAGRFDFCQGCTNNCYMDTASTRVMELSITT